MARKFLAALLVLAIVQPASAQTGTRDGAIMGGLGGAVLGGVIGSKKKETTQGALIGGAVGAVAGGVIGNQRDQQLARERYYQQQAWQAQQQLQQQRRYTYHTQPTHSYPVQGSVVVTPGVTVSDVLSMTRSGVAESVMINHIYSTGVQRRLTASEIISLHQQGVSENVINALQQAPMQGGGVPTSMVVPQATTTVVVEEPAVMSPPAIRTSPSYYAPSQTSPRRGF
jgi:outer membrane lipoprotein SlyB